MRRNGRTGFTLVELLVVIGIIALLISILLPAMTSARRQAMKTKCAAQMRDLGNAMLMYAQDNKGYLPSVRLSVAYQIGDTIYAYGQTESTTPPLLVQETVKWWCFLAKYVTKTRPMAQDPGQMNDEMRSVFWCPAFAGYSDAGNQPDLISGVNRNFPGFGMNWFPTSTGANPVPDSTYTNAPSTAATSNPPYRFSDLTSKASTAGKWYKLAQYTQTSQRALLADSRQFYLEAGYIAPRTSIPGQRLNYASDDYSAASLNGQTSFDFYRHGIYPPVQNAAQTTGTYSPTGGKIGYNILFADNHVESPIDRETGYRACRMLFPG